jgi:hypothetical protein
MRRRSSWGNAKTALPGDVAASAAVGDLIG